MPKQLYIQDDLPNFHQALAEASQAGLDKMQHIAQQYIHYARMLQKCYHSKKSTLIQRQKQILMDTLRG